MKKILVCILFILGLLSVESKAQKVAVKSNRFMMPLLL